MAQAVSVLVYQIGGSKLQTAQTFGLPAAALTGPKGVFPTRTQSGAYTQFDETVDPTLQGTVYAGINIKNGRHGYKTYYTNSSVATIIAAVNA